MENSDATNGVNAAGGSGVRDHVLRRPLHAAITAAGTDPAAITEAVLRSLDDQHVITYAPRDTLAILTAPGRVLVVLTERPASTLREIALVLGTTESNVARSVSKLIGSNVIARTKVAGRNIYTVNAETVRNHPDLRRYNDAVLKLLDIDSDSGSASTP